jgi:YHS domain-containing protein
MSSGLKLTLGLAMVAACLALAIADRAMAQSASRNEGAAKCPVCGEAASKEASIAYKGGKLCFCSADCMSKFKENPAKYQAKANEQLVITGQAKQVRCPLCGGKLDPSTKMTVCGTDVCFCGEKCQNKVKSASADEQREMVFGKGFDKAFKVKREKKSNKS